MFLENIEKNIRTGKVLKTFANGEHGGADINPLTFFPDKRFARKLYTCRFPVGNTADHREKYRKGKPIRCKPNFFLLPEKR